MTTRDRTHSSSGEESPSHSTAHQETPKTVPKSPPKSSIKSTPAIGTPLSTNKMYASGLKGKIDYSNSKEVHQCLQDLDNVIAKRKQELSSIQRSSAISGGHRRKLARTTETPLKMARNLDKDLSLVDDKTNAISPERNLFISGEVQITPHVIVEDKGNEADNSDHESLSSISSKGSGAASVVDMPVVLASGAATAQFSGSKSNILSTCQSPCSPAIFSPHGGSRNAFKMDKDFDLVMAVNESLEGDTSHQADTQESSPEGSSMQIAPEEIATPPKLLRGIIPSHIESISLPNSATNSSFVSETSLSDDDANAITVVVPLPVEVVTVTTVANVNDSALSTNFCSAMISHLEDESDLPDSSRTVHPETYTVADIEDHMDVEHATVQFGDTRYDNIHLRIDSMADLGDLPSHNFQVQRRLMQSVDGPENNFGVAMEEVVESGDREEMLNDSVVEASLLVPNSTNQSHGSVDSSVRRSPPGVEEEFLLGRSSDSPLLSTSPVPTRRSPLGPHSGSGSGTKRLNSSNISLNGSLDEMRQVLSPDQERELDSSNMSRLGLNSSGIESSFVGSSMNLNASIRKASFLESEAKLLKRHLSVYQLKNALLKEEVMQITKMSEGKFQEVLQHMTRLEQERNKVMKDRSQAQEELLAEQEELLFVRGQLQGKSARVIDLESELLASQRLVVALQKEAKIWRISQSNTPSTGNTPTNSGEKEKTSKKVHFHFSPFNHGDEFAAMDPFHAILLVLEQLDDNLPNEKDRLQNFLRNNHREKISLEAQVHELDNKLQAAESHIQEYKSKEDNLERAELEVGKMAIEMESLQAQLVEAFHERDEILVQVQQLREELSVKDKAFQELEAKHKVFMQDYEHIQGLLSDIQGSLASKDAEIAEVRKSNLATVEAMNEELQRRRDVGVGQVTIVAKESDLAVSKGQAVAVAGPTLRSQYSKSSVYIVKTTGYTNTLFVTLVLQLIILALLLLYLQVNFQMIMLTDNDDIIERLMQFRSAF
jgi:hypothetical protein